MTLRNAPIPWNVYPQTGWEDGVMRGFLVVALIVGLMQSAAAGAVFSRSGSDTEAVRVSAPLIEGRAAYESNGSMLVRPYHLDDVPPIG